MNPRLSGQTGIYYRTSDNQLNHRKENSHLAKVVRLRMRGLQSWDDLMDLP